MNKPAKIEVPSDDMPVCVYGKIASITGKLAENGIAKSRKANFGNFRGIDDVYNALAPLLSSHRLSIMPRIVSREVIERSSKSGNALFYVTVEAEFDFVSGDDGSTHTVRTFGEAMDTSDKATNKAMSAAYKYAAFMTFCIPTEGGSDAEDDNHEVSGEMPASNYAKIIQLIEDTNSNVPLLMEAIGAPKNKQVSALSPGEWEKAVSALENKLARMAKEETDAKAKATENA